MGVERRSITLDSAAVGVKEDRFYGYAYTFGSSADIGDPETWGFVERIRPGAFSGSIHDDDIAMLVNHDPMLIVARKSAGTLELREDNKGVSVSSTLDKSLSYVSDLASNLKNGNIAGMSVGMVVEDDEVGTENRSGRTVTVRTINKARLIEVSAVAFPAYEDTEAQLRSNAAEVRSRTMEPTEVKETRTALATHSTATDDSAWDSAANVRSLPSEEGPLRACFAWADEEGEEDNKSSYRFPHHFVSSDGSVGAASTRACSNGIAVLNGGRGGTTIPTGDRQGVYNHLARHLRDAGMEPPELRGEDRNPSISELRMRTLAARYGLSLQERNM